MTTTNKNETEVTKKEFSLDGFLFNALIFCVIIVFPATLFLLTLKFWA